MPEAMEIGRHPVASHLQLLVCEMDDVHAASVDRRASRAAREIRQGTASFRRVARGRNRPFLPMSGPLTNGLPRRGEVSG
jgi:hypothetical protein